LKPPPFTYHRPETGAEVDALLAEVGPDAKILAGGQSLIPILNMRLAQPGHVIDINHLRAESAEPDERDGHLAFGPLVRQATAERSSRVARLVPLVAETMEHVAHPAIRTRGTIVGSIAHADPAAELPAALTVLRGEVQARSVSGVRTIAAENCFAGPLENSLNANEWLSEVRFPIANGAGHAFVEFARRSGDYALCGVAVTATPAPRDRAVIAFSYLGMGDVPRRLVLAPMTHSEIEHPTLDEAIHELVDAHLDPHDDIHASAAFRSFLARRLGCRAARRAWERMGQ
jgi:aerobic carbon-monoxide dehydrogenase medium subunit